MKTDKLISLLATGGAAVTVPTAGRRYAMAIGGGAAGAGLLMLALLGIRPDLGQAALLPMFWLKIGFVASLAGAGLFATQRLARPGAQLRWLPLALALPVLGMWAVAAFTLVDAEPLERAKLFYGATWKSCPLLIALLSAPAFVALLRVMQDLAPTRPRLAGCASGLLAGAVAALVYCLHCPEMGAPFIGFWYLLGMLLPAGVGAALGNALLRW